MAAMLAKLVVLYGGAALVLVVWSGFFALILIGVKLFAYYRPRADFDFANIRRFFLKGAIYILALPIFVWMLIYISAIPLAYYQYKICVEFPNGILLGRTSFLDRETIDYIRDPYPTKIFLSLKLPDGTILTRDNITELHFSKTTIYGVLDKAYSRGWGEGAPYRFAYRPDVGFVLAQDDLALYRKLREEAGELITPPKASSENYSVRPPWEDYMNEYIAKIYFPLIGDPAYRRDDCPLDIFP